MTTREILDQFYTYVDDDEIGDDQALILAQKAYDKVNNDRDWVWYKKLFQGTQSTTLPYISLNNDFKNIFTRNRLTYHTVIRVGANYDEFRLIDWQQIRNNRTNVQGFYIDYSYKPPRLVFTSQPSSANPVEFDYIFNPPKLDLDGSDPLFPDRFHMVIPLRMAADFPLIEGQEKSRSYRDEYKEEAAEILQDMRMEDAKAKLTLV